MRNELLYNQSGAKDETAYGAIVNTLKEGGEMGVNEGEVWEIMSGTNTRYAVIIRRFEDYAATVMLQDHEPKENGVAVRVWDIMYADVGRLGWIFYDKVVCFVRKLTEEEEQELLQAIGVALEIPTPETANLRYEIKKLREDLEEAYDNMEANARLADEAEDRATEAENRATAAEARQGTGELIEDRGLREDLAAARKEAEIYKGLYEDMLRRALG